LNAGTTPIYVSTSFAVSGDLNVPAGKSIVITTNPPTSNTLVLSEGGALFNIVPPTATTPVLTVNGRLTLLGKDASIVLGNTSTQSGKLVIGSTGKVLVTSGASISATTSSQIQLAAAASTLVFEDSTAKLNVVGTLGTGDKVVGTGTEKALVILPSAGSAALTIGKDNIADPAKLGSTTDYTGGPKLASATTSTAVKANLVTGSTVIYSGSDALTDIDSLVIPTGATLIITGTVNQVDYSITATDTGKLEVAATGKVTTRAGLPANLKNDGVIETTNSSLDYNSLKALVGADGSGTIVLMAAVTGVTAPLELKQNLEINTAGSITYTSGATAFASASAVKNVTIKSNGKLILGSTITSLGSTVTVSNGGSDPAAISTEDGDALNSILAAVTGNIAVTGTDVSIITGTTVRNGTTLNIKESAKLTVPSGKTFTIDNSAKVVVASGGELDLSALFTPPTGTNVPGIGGTSNGKVALHGELVVASGATLKISMGNGSALPPEIDWTQGGSVTIANGGKISLATVGADAPYIAATGTDGALYTWDAGGPTTGSITLSNGKMDFTGKITAANPGGYIGSGIVATVTNGSEFTVSAGSVYGDYYGVDGTLIVEGKLILSASKKLKVANGGAVVIKDAATLDIASSAELWLEGATSKLVVSPSGTVDVKQNGVISDWNTSPHGEVDIKLFAYTGYDTVNQAVTKVTSATVASPASWTLTATSGNIDTLVPAITIKLGTLQLAIVANVLVNDGTTGTTANVTASRAAEPVATTATAGILKASTGTTVVFTGSDPTS
jgi:hypothetical protein